jgi:hypothetical protein
MTPVNPNDEIRLLILKYFYERNAGAPSRFGKKGSAVKISDAKRELKARHKLTQQQVMSNLTYLIDRGWVKTVTIEKTVTVRGGTIPSPVTWYEVAAPGIEKIEGDSEFRPTDRFAGINISATGSNVITLGDGNVVNAQYQGLHKALEALKGAVTSGSSLTESQKLEVAVDIESLKDQLVKPKPNRGVIAALWTSIQTTVTGLEFGEYVMRIGQLIGPLLTSG